MSQRIDNIPEPEKKLPFLKRVERFVIDSIGKLILIFVLVLAGVVAAIFHWGGFVGAPLVHASIRFMFGMESSWDSLEIDWLDRRLTIKNLVMYQPEGYNKKIFFKAEFAECELNKYTGTQEFNIKKLAVYNPEFVWEFNKDSDSMRRFFEYLNSGKQDKEEKYNLRIDKVVIQDGVFELIDFVTLNKGIHIGIRQVQSEMKDISNYYSSGEEFPSRIKISGMLNNSKGMAVTPIDLMLDMNLITYAANFKASINVGHIDLRILDPYCVDTMGVHLTKGSLGLKTVEGICREGLLTTNHIVNLDYLDFEPCKPGESEEDPWLNLVKWVKRLDAPKERREFTVNLNGPVGDDANLQLSTSDMTIRVVFEKLAGAFDKWFKSTVHLKRRKIDHVRRK